MSEISGALRAKYLKKPQQDALEALLDVHDGVQRRNQLLEDYYAGDVMVKDVGVDVLPKEADVHVDLSCDWPHKAVEALANRSRLDSFVFADGGEDAPLARIALDCSLKTSYKRHLVGQLKRGCMFATVGRQDGATYVRFHGADSAAGIWDELHDRLGSGFVVADRARTSYSRKRAVPVQLNLHMPGSVTVIRRSWERPGEWVAETQPQPNDRPLMEAFRFQPTDSRPLGQSRITKAVRDLTDDVLRVRLALAISTAFYAVPQKFMLGLTDEQFDRLVNSKWSTYIGSVLLTTRDGDSGEVPQVGQLASNSPQALIDLIRSDAAMFAGATSVPLNSLGIVQDNPSSAEAIEAARADLIDLADDLNDTNGESLRNVALMAMAVGSNKAIADLGDAQRSVIANFKDPRMASISASADAACKVAAVDAGFADTDVFYEMQGFDAATIARIKAQKRRAGARMFLGQNQPKAVSDEGDATRSGAVS